MYSHTQERSKIPIPSDNWQWREKSISPALAFCCLIIQWGINFLYPSMWFFCYRAKEPRISNSVIFVLEFWVKKVRSEQLCGSTRSLGRWLLPMAVFPTVFPMSMQIPAMYKIFWFYLFIYLRKVKVLKVYYASLGENFESIFPSLAAIQIVD